MTFGLFKKEAPGVAEGKEAALVNPVIQSFVIFDNIWLKNGLFFVCSKLQCSKQMGVIITPSVNLLAVRSSLYSNMASTAVPHAPRVQSRRFHQQPDSCGGGGRAWTISSKRYRKSRSFLRSRPAPNHQQPGVNYIQVLEKVDPPCTVHA